MHMFDTAIWPWLGFTIFVVALLALDLGVFHRKAHAVSTREALIWSGVWIGLALAFNAGLYLVRGPDTALQFFTGWLIEKSLSIDNIFVFVLLFSTFVVPPIYQHRVLFWGILGALVMRGALIAVGAVLLEEFHWILYVFGAFLIFTGIRMGVQREKQIDPGKNVVLRLARSVLPVTDGYERDCFMVMRAGRLVATPLLLVLLIIESTDLVFAVDSIPAVFAVTDDPFIVYTSNVFAILGLRSLYFVFAGVIDKFTYLKPALAVILSFVGVKMLLADVLPLPSFVSLAFIALVLLLAIGASLLRGRREAGRRVEAADKVEDAVEVGVHEW
jgi:tellurite resistance protein TerC